MILDQTYSEIGRSTNQQLNALRRQLGMGVDPAFDYSKMVEAQKKLMQGHKEKKTSGGGDSANNEGANSGPASGLDLLKRALREVIGSSGGLDDPEADEAGDESADAKRGASMPADLRELRDRTRPSASFKSQSRNEITKLDVTNRFRAPPPGSYRPKDDLLMPRLKGTDFGMKEATKSLKAVYIEREIERLQEEKQPFDHLTKSATSIEMQETLPDKAKSRMANYQFGKQLQRPSMVKSANLHFHDNSFTAGVLSGDLSTSTGPARNPEWDFAKTSTAKPKPREYFFQPGQYKVKIEAIKPKGELKNIPFHKQQERKSMKEAPRAGEHLPDRSLARPAAFSKSCPQLVRRVQVPDIAKYTTRPPIITTKADYHDTSDRVVDEAVMGHRLTYDAHESIKPTRPKSRTTEDFNKSLDRKQHHLIMRSYGEDVCMRLSERYSRTGPVSSEELPMDYLNNKKQLNLKVQTRDISKMASRDHTRQYTESPPRKKDFSHVAKFEREVRDGDSRPEPDKLSILAEGIAEKRGARSYHALPREDHPRLSIEKRPSQ